jgi:PRC-barrel domain
MKHIAILSTVTLLSLSGLTIAQTNAPATKPATTNAMTVSEQGTDQVLASKLVGATIYSPSDEKVGNIQYLVMNKSGQVDAVVVGVGGFLGIDKKDVALTFSSLNVTYDVDNSVKKITANVTKESMKSAPAYYFLKKS